MVGSMAQLGHTSCLRGESTVVQFMGNHAMSQMQLAG